MSAELINTLMGVAVSVLAGILVYIVQNRIRNRIHAVQVCGARSKTADDFLDLYTKLMPSNERNSPQHVRRWLEEARAQRWNRHRTDDFVVIVAKLRGRVVGFFCYDYLFDKRYLLVNWYGIDKTVAYVRRFASRVLLRKVRRLVRGRYKHCIAILYETEALGPDLTMDQNRKRRARKDLFADNAFVWGLETFELPIGYIQPKLFPDDAYVEEPMSLLLIPLLGKGDLRLTKTEIIEMLRCIYFAWYGDSYGNDPILSEKYFQYLRTLMQEIEPKLPEEITLHLKKAHAA